MLGNLFDPKGEFFNHDRMRPHWSQAGAIVFVTARTHDSIPREAVLHWTATQINRKTGLRGHFWQQEPFDHLVRSVEQYEYLRRYIADNPKKAGLQVGEYYYRMLEE